MEKLWHWYLALETAWQVAIFGVLVPLTINVVGFLIWYTYFSKKQYEDIACAITREFKKQIKLEQEKNQTLIDHQIQNIRIRDVTQTVEVLPNIAKGNSTFARQAQAALDQLGKAQGQELLTLAQSLDQLTQTYEQKRSTNDRIAAQLYRGRGALAFVHDTQTALHNYQRATELDPHNLEGWNQLGLLQFRVGKLDAAAASYKKVEILATEPTHHATIYGNLGILYHTQDNLEQAKIFYRKALAINKALGHKECIAGNYATLGIIYQNRGDLEQAKNFYRKALAINEALGRKESMAGDYANLGIICHIRDDLEQAEDFYRKALAINEALGSKENMIGDYGNLGNIYYTRGKLEQAEAFYRKALAISEKLGNKQLIASIYFNLGNLYQTRGNLEQAREYWRKALALFEQIGMPHQAQKVRDLLK